MIRFGGPVFPAACQKAAGAGESHGGCGDPAELARLAHAKGFRAAYAPAVALQDAAGIRACREAFARYDIAIAEVGFWENLLDADAAVCAAHRRQMRDCLALAEELGARCAVNILGSYCRGNGNSAHSPRNFTGEAFDAAVELARSFLDEVKPRRAYFCYEIFPFNCVDSPPEIARLVAAVDRPQFGVHLDLVNLINSPRAYWRSGAIMEECVALFGHRIVSAHAKDVRLKQPAISVILEEVIPGQGALDLAANVRALHRLPHDVPYMMEHLGSEAEYDQAAAHIRQVAAREGIAL